MRRSGFFRMALRACRRMHRHGPFGTPALCAGAALCGSAILAEQTSSSKAAKTPSAASAAASSAASSTLPQQGHRIEDDYELGPELGRGAFATVRRGRCRVTGIDVAIKVVPKSLATGDSIRHEASVLQRVSMHRSIAKLEAFYETDTHFYIVMEFVAGGELFDLICDQGAFPERDAAALLQDVSGAVALLHAQGMCHADIKPENMLLTQGGKVKLVDFGLSCELSSDNAAHKSAGGPLLPPPPPAAPAPPPAPPPPPQRR